MNYFHHLPKYANAGFLCAAMFLLSPVIALGANANYVPLEGIPGIPQSSGNLPQYLNSIYKVLITLGAMVAVIKIIIGGVKWSMSGIVTDKSDAKHEILGSLFGLAILLVPYIVLKTINPDLLNMDVLKNTNVKIDLIVAPNGGGSPEITNGPGGTVQTTGNGTTITTGTVVQNCNYDDQSIPTGQTDMNGAPIYMTVYDRKKCEESCRAKSGTFTPFNEESGKCTYLETTTSTDGPGTGGYYAP